MHRVSKNHWRLVLSPDGELSGHPGKKHRHRGVHPANLLLILILLALLRRRRRASEV